MSCAVGTCAGAATRPAHGERTTKQSKQDKAGRKQTRARSVGSPPVRADTAIMHVEQVRGPRWSRKCADNNNTAATATPSCSARPTATPSRTPPCTPVHKSKPVQLCETECQQLPDFGLCDLGLNEGQACQGAELQQRHGSLFARHLALQLLQIGRQDVAFVCDLEGTERVACDATHTHSGSSAKAQEAYQKS